MSNNDTEPDHEAAMRDATILMRLSERDDTEHGRRAGNVGRAYQAARSELAELRARLNESTSRLTEATATVTRYRKALEEARARVGMHPQVVPSILDNALAGAEGEHQSDD